MDSLSQCVAGETATQVKERSVSNGSPTALPYSFTVHGELPVKGLVRALNRGGDTVRFDTRHSVQYSHANLNKVGMYMYTISVKNANNGVSLMKNTASFV